MCIILKNQKTAEFRHIYSAAIYNFTPNCDVVCCFMSYMLKSERKSQPPQLITKPLPGKKNKSKQGQKFEKGQTNKNKIRKK